MAIEGGATPSEIEGGQNPLLVTKGVAEEGITTSVIDARARCR